jgi:hypothetical protein
MIAMAQSSAWVTGGIRFTNDLAALVMPVS